MELEQLKFSRGETHHSSAPSCHLPGLNPAPYLLPGPIYTCTNFPESLLLFRIPPPPLHHLSSLPPSFAPLFSLPILFSLSFSLSLFLPLSLPLSLSISPSLSLSSSQVPAGGSGPHCRADDPRCTTPNPNTPGSATPPGTIVHSVD